MPETHVFGNYVPQNARYLILGSFQGKQAVKDSLDWVPSYDWFYGTLRNHFWPILAAVYDKELSNLQAKQALFTELGIAITDIIYQCDRRDGSNLDSNLVNIVYNSAIVEIIDANPIEKIFFTSRFVKTRFRKAFKDTLNRHPDVELIVLPSPSPRNTRLTKAQKILRYKALLPSLPPQE